jgi:hypothetical protein
MRPFRPPALLLPVVVCLILAPSHVWAQENRQVTTPNSSTSDNCLRRSIPLTVLHNGQQSQSDLKQVQVLVNGSQVSTVALTQYNGPLRVLLLVDTSASMKARVDEHWDTALPTAAFAMDSMPLNAVVAVGTFAERLHVSPWKDRDGAREEVLSLKNQSPKGTTALYSAVTEAASSFRGNQFADVIYLVTDGGENHSRMNFGPFVENLVARGVRIFVFLVVPREPKTPEEINGPQEMEDLATQTGGLLLRLPWSKDWVSGGGASALAKRVREAAASPYEVQFQLPGAITKSSKLKIEGPFDLKHETVSYPRRLEPCTMAASN